MTLLGLMLGLVTPVMRFLGRIGVRALQHSVTHELAKWAQEYSQIRTDQDAFRAIDMLGYIERYYIPAEGYRSDPATEAALESQRQRTKNAIIEALERYTGEHYGQDRAQWEAWRRERETSDTAGT